LNLPFPRLTNSCKLETSTELPSSLIGILPHIHIDRCRTATMSSPPTEQTASSSASNTTPAVSTTSTATESSSSSTTSTTTESSSCTAAPAPTQFISPAPCLSDVRASSAWVVGQARHVEIDDGAIESELSRHPQHYSPDKLPPSWASSYHFCDGTPLTAQYIFVLDALNFCFWPLDGYEYSDLADSLKRVLQQDNHAFDAQHLLQLTEEKLEGWLQPPPQGHFWQYQAKLDDKRQYKEGGHVPIPLLAQRTRALRELGWGLIRFYNGHAANVVRAAQGDASRLVELLTASFPAFRDSCLYKGRQLFLYKRAQILVGDLWGAFGGQGLGAFNNIEQLTCFADYRVPQLLRALGILKYDESLASAIDRKEELIPGEQEMEIRAATIQAVERMVTSLKEKGVAITSQQLDWLLWERGEATMEQLKPHHRTLTIFY